MKKRIGVASPLDIGFFISYFESQENKELIMNNRFNAAATAVHTLVLALLDDGHYITIFTLSKKSFSIKGRNIEIHGIERYNKYPIKYLWSDFINAVNIKKCIKNHLTNLDVLHAHWTYTYAYAASAYTQQIPVFCTVRDWATYIWKIESTKNKITWSFRVLMNDLVFKTRNVHFISNSPYTAARVEKKYNITTPIIPNPIKDSFLKLDEHKPPINLELLCVSSSNDKRKNVKTLLYSFQKLLGKYSDAHLSLIGVPFSNGNETMELWRTEGLLKNVTLVGSVNHDELKNYFDRARIFVAPSLEETFGNTLLESMARKVPIVAGENSGAIPYVLHHGKAGFLCDVSSIVVLSNQIEQVYQNQEKANSIVLNAYNILLSEYLAKDVCKKHIQLYEKYK